MKERNAIKNNQNVDKLYANQYNNLDNLLGQTVKNTIILPNQNQNQINNQNPNLKKNIQIQKPNVLPGYKAVDNKPKPKYFYPENNLYAQKRFSDRYKQHPNYIHTAGNINNNKKTNRGLYKNMRKLNSIMKDGKLICNIDINNDAQGLINEEPYIDKNNIIYKNHANINNHKPLNTQDIYKNRGNMNLLYKNYQNYNTFQENNKVINNQAHQKINPYYQFPNQLSKQPNQVLKYNTNQQIIQNKKEEPKYQIKNTNITNINQKEIINNNNKNQQIIPDKTIVDPKKSIRNSNQNESIKNTKYQPIIPNQDKTLDSYCNQKESIKNTSYQPINPNPDKTLNSNYQIRDSNCNQTESIKNTTYQPISPNPDKTLNSNYQIRDSNCNQTESIKNNNNSILPQETIKSIYQNIESSKSQKIQYPKVLPQETVKSIYQTKVSNENKNNPYSKILPQETVKSIYQPKEGNILSKISPGETIQSIYCNKAENNQLTTEERQNIFSKFMPTETIVSIYEDKNKKLESDNPLLEFLPNETVKSVYQTQNSVYQSSV